MGRFQSDNDLGNIRERMDAESIDRLYDAADVLGEMDPEPRKADPSIPAYDLKMIDMAERELATANVRIRFLKLTDERAQELAVGVASDYFDTVMRALSFYRAELRRAA